MGWEIGVTDSESLQCSHFFPMNPGLFLDGTTATLIVFICLSVSAPRNCGN